MRDSGEIQEAVFARLDGEIGDGVGLYDQVPERDEEHELVLPPYVTLGDTTWVPDDTHDGFGSIETLTLHVWSDAKGTSEAKTIMGAIVERLHQVTLTLDSGRQIRLVAEFAEVIPEDVDEESNWRHGVLRFRARVLHLLPIGG